MRVFSPEWLCKGLMCVCACVCVCVCIQCSVCVCVCACVCVESDLCVVWYGERGSGLLAGQTWSCVCVCVCVGVQGSQYSACMCMATAYFGM